MNPNEVQTGDVLIGNGLVITPALLLDKKLRLDEGRLLDFCTFVNALIMHDRLITLSAQIPDHLAESRLYKYLKHKKILNELDFDYNNFGEDEKFEMMDLFGASSDAEWTDHLLGDLQENMCAAHLCKEYYVNTTTGEAENRINLQRSRFIDEVIDARIQDWSRGVPTNSVLNSSDDLKLHRLRTLAYWEVSGNLSMRFLPDFMRIPIIAGYRARLRQSLRLLMAATVDEPTRAKLSDAMVILDPVKIPIPIPSAVTNFLDRYVQSSMEDAIDNLREEFEEWRKEFASWEEKMNKIDDTTVKEILQRVSEIKSTLEAVRGKDYTEIAISVTSRVATDALSGNIGTSAAEPLIKEGISLISRYFRRRRISIFDANMNQANNIKNQQDLLKHAFKSQLKPRQLDRFVQLSNALGNLS